MNWKNRLTNYNFWISIFSAVLLILQALKIEFDFIYINEIFTAILGLLVVIGIINDPTRSSVKTTEKTEAKQETLPIDKENETNNGNIQNGNEIVLETVDFKTLLNKISTDVNEKIKELVNINKETLKKLHLDRKSEVEEFEEVKASNVHVETEQNVTDELDNPYVDIVK